MSFLARLTSACTIQSISTTISSIGEVIVSYSTGTKVDCRPTPMIIKGEGESAARIVDITKQKLFLPPTAVVVESSRIQHGGQNWNVLQVPGFPGGTGAIHHYEVIIERAD